MRTRDMRIEAAGTGILGTGRVRRIRLRSSRFKLGEVEISLLERNRPICWKWKRPVPSWDALRLPSERTQKVQKGQNRP